VTFEDLVSQAVVLVIGVLDDLQDELLRAAPAEPLEDTITSQEADDMIQHPAPVVVGHGRPPSDSEGPAAHVSARASTRILTLAASAAAIRLPIRRPRAPGRLLESGIQELARLRHANPDDEG
jgi:hypothetical protein